MKSNDLNIANPVTLLHHNYFISEGKLGAATAIKAAVLSLVFQKSINKHLCHDTPLHASLSFASAWFVVARLSEECGGSCEGQGALYSCSAHQLDLQTGI